MVKLLNSWVVPEIENYQIIPACRLEDGYECLWEVLCIYFRADSGGNRPPS
jgi:hypothetical protein